jgi:hypothetical protein
LARHILAHLHAHKTLTQTKPAKEPKSCRCFFKNAMIIFAEMKGFYIFCDESLKKGKYYSNFYGGVLIDKSEFEK